MYHRLLAYISGMCIRGDLPKSNPCDGALAQAHLPGVAMVFLNLGGNCADGGLPGQKVSSKQIEGDREGIWG